MKKLIFFVLISATACWAKDDASAPSSAAKPKAFLVDPAAVALFDRAAKLYSGCKTIRMRWKTERFFSVQGAVKKPTTTAITFVRPSHSKIEIENGAFPREIYINRPLAKVCLTSIHAIYRSERV